MPRFVLYLLALFLLCRWATGAAAPLSDPTLQVQSPEVRAAFAKGAPLLENAAYKIHASRRTEPGQAEVHVLDTDIIYVIEGGATLVTGGVMTNPTEVAPREIRGAAIEGGTAREIGPGDVLVVPHGTPHWFQSVRGPVLYYVVKVTASEVR